MKMCVDLGNCLNDVDLCPFNVQDHIGEFFYDSKSDVHVYWVSFLDGMQRVLLFTEDLALATYAQQVGNFISVVHDNNTNAFFWIA